MDMSGKVRKQYGKMRKCWLILFILFSHCFPNNYFCRSLIYSIFSESPHSKLLCCIRNIFGTSFDKCFTSRVEGNVGLQTSCHFVAKL